MKKKILFLSGLIALALFSCKNNVGQKEVEAKVKQLSVISKSLWGEEPDATLFSKSMVGAIKLSQL